MTTIFFDMDGTIANLYGIENWLEMLTVTYDPFPYENAKPLLNLQALARILNRLQREGFRIEIISWLAKDAPKHYDEKVTLAKLHWLSVHLHSVSFDKINIVEYGVDKDTFRHTDADILFDDELKNRMGWGGQAFGVENIIEILKAL